MKNIINVSIADLKYHPINEQIYTAPSSGENLIASIRSLGQLNPITISEDNFIISGNERVKA